MIRSSATCRPTAFDERSAHPNSTNCRVLAASRIGSSMIGFLFLAEIPRRFPNDIFTPKPYQINPSWQAWFSESPAGFNFVEPLLREQAGSAALPGKGELAFANLLICHSSPLLISLDLNPSGHGSFISWRRKTSRDSRRPIRPRGKRRRRRRRLPG